MTTATTSSPRPTAPAQPVPSQAASVLSASLAQCATLSGDLRFAMQFLSRDRRRQVGVTVAVLSQLHAILTDHATPQAPAAPPVGAPQACDSAGCGQAAVSCPGAASCGAASSCEASADHAGAPACGQSSACGVGGCGGESSAMRRAVCASVLDHLLSRQPTGRPELDGFADIVGQTGQPREQWDLACDRMPERPALPRYAGWDKLCRELIAWTSPSVGLLWLSLGGEREHVATVDSPGEAGSRTASQRQLEALGAVFAWIDALTQLPTDWRAGRLLIALDDLHAVGLSDRALGRWLDALTSDAGDVVAGRDSGDSRDPRALEVVTPPVGWGLWARRALERVDRIMDAAGPVIASLPADSRLALHVLWRLQRRRLAGLEAGSFDIPERHAFWRRIALVPAALTQAARLGSSTRAPSAGPSSAAEAPSP